MKFKIVIKIFVFTLIFSFYGCNNSPELAFEEYGYDKTIGNCDQGICVDIHLKYYVLHEPKKVAGNFNSEMEAIVYGKMAMEGQQNKIDIEKSIQAIINDYEAQLKEFPDAATGGYIQNTSSRISYESSTLVCFNIISDTYSGGAHGMYWDEYLNIDPTTGEKINMTKFIKDMEAFTKYVEEELRSKLGMNNSDEWSEFTFLDTFTLPENMGMTENGLRLIYNPYELLSYADGKIEIVISKEELKAFMDLP